MGVFGRHKNLIVFFLALFACYSVFYISGNVSLENKVSANPIQQLDKEGILNQMRTLQSSIISLKQQVASKGDTSSKQALDSALSQYEVLKLSLGGDEPTPTSSTSTRSIQKPGKGTTNIVPAGCGETTTNFANNISVAIPTGPAVVSSTINVSGLDTYLFDVDLLTNITHTFAGDLDITLTSPAGTVVTITTDNGGGNDNVFNGTTFDDDANPAGQVPYAANNGVTTDHTYVNLVTATPLTPEEPLAAFIGENPNGVWTLTVSDDAAGDGGAFTWALNVSTLPTAPAPTMSSFTNNTPVAIPTGPAVVTQTINVSGAGTFVGDVNLLANITHTFAGDLDITLTSPAGTVVTITTDNGGGNDNVFAGTLFDDDANPAGQVPYAANNGVTTDHTYVNLVTATPLTPEEPFGAFIGEDPNGVWTLTVSDDAAGDSGTINSLTLQITTIQCGGATLEHATVYAADTVNNRIQRSTDDGLTWSPVGFGAGTTPGRFNAPKGVSSDSTDMIVFVADTNNNRIQRSTDGGLTWQILLPAGIAVGQVNRPQGVAYDEINDILYVADTGNSRVQMVTSGCTATIATPSNFSIYAGATIGTAIGKFNQPTGIAVDINGGVYVSDTNNNRIQFNVTGSALGWAIYAGASSGVTLGKVNSPRGLYVTTDGVVFVADTFNNRIQVNMDGSPTGWSLFMGAGTAVGSVNGPEGVVLAASGNVFIGDTRNNRIQKKVFLDMTHSGAPTLTGASVIVGPPGLPIGFFSQPGHLR